MKKIENMELFLAQRGKCFYCGELMSIRRGEPFVGWTADHFFPKCNNNSLNGNIVLAHENCNQKKASRLPTNTEKRRKDALYKRIARRLHLIEQKRNIMQEEN